MLVPERSQAPRSFKLTSVEDYEPLVGAEAVERLLKVEALRDLHVVNVNSTYYGGGVAEILSSLTLLMNASGIKTGWRVIQGRPDFFSITKKMHNALQGAEINLTGLKMQIYEEVAYENSARMHLDHDVVIVHDPQPLPLIQHFRKNAPWVWRCHVDLSHPNPTFGPTSRRWSSATMRWCCRCRNTRKICHAAALHHAGDQSVLDHEQGSVRCRDCRPLCTLQHPYRPAARGAGFPLRQVERPARRDRRLQIARQQVDCTLVLLGNVATDDPEGQEVFVSLCNCGEDRIHILSVQDSALINALQRRAAVVLQKSIREGFGLTVTEAMWKGAAVIGGNVGGIKHQIEDGVNGFLVNNVEQAAARIVDIAQGRCVAGASGTKRDGDGETSISDDAPDGRLAGPDRIVRGALSIQGSNSVLRSGAL